MKKLSISVGGQVEKQISVSRHFLFQKLSLRWAVAGGLAVAIQAGHFSC